MAPARCGRSVVDWDKRCAPSSSRQLVFCRRRARDNSTLAVPPPRSPLGADPPRFYMINLLRHCAS